MVDEMKMSVDRRKQILPGLGKLIPFANGPLWRCIPAMSKLRPASPGFKEPAMGVVYTVEEGVAWLVAYRDGNLE